MTKHTGLSRVLWRISLPIMFAGVSEIVLHVTNTIFLARVGVTELAAIAIADSILELFLVLPLGLVDGIQVLTARHMGRRRPWAVGAVFRQGLLLLVSLAAALAVVLGVAGAVDRGPTRELAGRGYRHRGVPAHRLLRDPAHRRKLRVQRAVREPRPYARAGPATLVLAISNVVLDYVLIFGRFGAPALGIRGAAWAFIGAETATVAFLLGYLVVRGLARRFRLFSITLWSGRTVRRLLRLSAPVSAQALVEGLRWLVFFLILERVGAVPLAVANIVFACYEVFCIPTEAFGEAACSMVSRLIGRERYDRIEPVVRSSTLGAALATLPFVAVALVLPDQVLSLFTTDPALVDASRASLRVVALTMVALIPAEMWHTAVLGTGDTPAALGIEVAFTVVMLGACYWSAILRAWPLELVWGSLVLAGAVALAASYGWMKSGAWRRLAY
jgi:Na+-driven multidrug efflux pump